MMTDTCCRIKEQEADALRERIAELETAMRLMRDSIDSTEDIPTTCALIANKIDDLLANRDG